MPTTPRGEKLMKKHMVQYSTNRTAIQLSREEAGNRCSSCYMLTPDILTKLAIPSTLDGIIQTQYSIERREREGKDAIPTIAVMRDAFGDDMVSTWMRRNLDIFIELIGAQKNDVTGIQKQFMAQVLIDKFSQGQDRLNAAEVLLFFYKAAKGECGKVYGAINPIDLGELAETFLNWRLKVQDELEEKLSFEEDCRKQKELMECPPPTQEQLDMLHETMEMFGKSQRVKRDEDGFVVFTPDTPREKKIRDAHTEEFLGRFLNEEQRRQFREGTLQVPTTDNTDNTDNINND